MQFPILQILHLVIKYVKSLVCWQLGKRFLSDIQHSFKRHSIVNGGVYRKVDNALRVYTIIHQAFYSVVNHNGLTYPSWTHQNYTTPDINVFNKFIKGIKIQTSFHLVDVLRNLPSCPPRIIHSHPFNHLPF